ncbi:uncharacterized protein LOC121992867 isoform X1 [Zingiber officinale]|uniref:uncharacterized protein LOC121992867 isoform X1 n=1 Tax=Zingiber officinale TaxID=94328 RepID=UPI001C4B907F|nr:uncharacterized protein LOC121992867 isoform X1 [Zingiber officinale]
MGSFKSSQASLLRLSPVHFVASFRSLSPRLKKPQLSTVSWFFLKKARLVRSTRRLDRSHVVSVDEKNSGNFIMEEERPSFDLNLAVILAGFAFESYRNPPDDVGWREVDATDCQTVFLSEKFVREIYDGQLQVKLKKGVNFPAMDPWGTSDPYVVLQLDGQVVKSKVKWASKDPIWNENLTLNLKKVSGKTLQVMAWDANLVAPHKRMGNAAVSIESFCDGNLHEVEVDLEGIGGGGKIYLEVIYKSCDEIEKDKQWWRISFLSDILMKSSCGSALKIFFGSEGINVSQFVDSAFGQLNTFRYTYLEKPSSSNNDNVGSEHTETNKFPGSSTFLQQDSSPQSSGCSINNSNFEKEVTPVPLQNVEGRWSFEKQDGRSDPPDEYFWRTFADSINQTVCQKLGFSLPEIKFWDGFDMLNKASLQLRTIAEKEYVESGLATPEEVDDDEKKNDQPSTNGSKYSVLDIDKISKDVLSQTDTIFGALMILTSVLSKQRKDLLSLLDSSNANNKDISKTDDENVEDFQNETGNVATERFALGTQKADEMRELFSCAESALEAWAMLATSLGRSSLIKSDFEKICYLDNPSTDTQVAIWRDSLRKRLVVAFRGTEQSKWKDLRTDLMLLPVGLNPERLSGDFKQEVQVHSGFLSAYDSVKNRIMMLIKLSIDPEPEDDLSIPTWEVYVTGHSLGGALATLLALELSLSQMAKLGKLSVTMYNFGSPRVGNRRFAELYNEKVKDSWRVVNHRDIIPTVPRLMGYCHVAHPVYLAAGELKGLVDREFLGDGYQGDVIGEVTPDSLVNKFMRGEKQLIEQILQTEINLFRSIRDGTALMQHMEDFYYITLLESVRLNYRCQPTDKSNPSESL